MTGSLRTYTWFPLLIILRINNQHFICSIWNYTINILTPNDSYVNLVCKKIQDVVCKKNTRCHNSSTKVFIWLNRWNIILQSAIVPFRLGTPGKAPEGDGVWGSRCLVLTLDVPLENIYEKNHKKVPFYKRIPAEIQPWTKKKETLGKKYNLFPHFLILNGGQNGDFPIYVLLRLANTRIQ